MIGKTKNVNNYIGPRAIFDPSFIPPNILHRKKEQCNLFSILRDSLHDDFGLNLLYQGIQGIGKKVITNKVIQDLSKKEGKIINIKKIAINCKEKAINEILFSAITKISSFNNFKIDFNLIVNCKLTELWNLFKLVCSKSKNNLIFVFNNIENLNPECYKKVLQYLKESKISVISTINKVLKPGTLDLLNQFDIKKKLSYFSFKELFDIIKQRVNLTFLTEVDNELIELITDLIFEHYVPVPGKAIDILRELYQILTHHSLNNHVETIDILQRQFDSIQLTDEFSMLNYLSEEDIITLIFLDNLVDSFLRQPKYYITIDELKEIYYISCESIEYDKNTEAFLELLRGLHSVGIFNFSRKNNTITSRNDRKTLLNYDYYFMTINPKQLKAMVDALFNKF